MDTLRFPSALMLPSLLFGCGREGVENVLWWNGEAGLLYAIERLGQRVPDNGTK